MMDYEDRRPVWNNLLELQRYLEDNHDGWWVDGDDGSVNDDYGGAIVRDEIGTYYLFIDGEGIQVGEPEDDLDAVIGRAKIVAGVIVGGI